MSEKRVKAWAVVDARGNLAWADSPEHPLIRRTKEGAESDLEEAFPGERVVRVTVRIEE